MINILSYALANRYRRHFAQGIIDHQSIRRSLPNKHRFRRCRQMKLSLSFALQLAFSLKQWALLI
jgi:hypothetical protein